jgi:dihydroorotate dehydrogenase electron transfer subunit
MYTAIAKLPEIIGKSVQASLEVRMGCGFGLCYSCTVKTKAGLKQICKNGPIFDLNDILWDEFVDI